uniref:Uncharacterized protein n=1 Tax=Arundo donax TaxID=35708 RepID=A0A0A9GQD7_ARUDO
MCSKPRTTTLYSLVLILVFVDMGVGSLASFVSFYTSCIELCLFFFHYILYQKIISNTTWIT